MAHPSNDLRSALATLPTTIEGLLARALRENEWPTYATVYDEGAREEAVRALAAMTLDGDADVQLLEDGMGWSVMWVSRWWHLCGHVYPHADEPAALDPESPIVLVHRSPSRYIHGPQVVRMGLVAIRDRFLVDELQAARARRA